MLQGRWFQLRGMRFSTAWRIAAFFLVTPLVLSGGLQAAQGPQPRLAASAVQQIEALRSLKTTRTTTQNKIDSRLFLGLLHQRNDSRLAPLTAFRFVQPQADGKVPVDILVASAAGVKQVNNKLASLG